ncbi:hypothetical protein C8Q72DRAFT_799258 [Fomitopsis betulina]|nr:hypothetical protein C8Q72DRAFT_799258 [Fomitopsis betulina]
MFASRLYEQVRMAGFLLLLRLTAPSFNPRLRKIAICATTGGGRILLLSWWRSGELLDYFLDEPESVKLPSRALPFEVVKLASDHRGWERAAWGEHRELPHTSDVAATGGDDGDAVCVEEPCGEVLLVEIWACGEGKECLHVVNDVESGGRVYN